MMKKQGFTLAEVLITLTIIGVIATMTLPALMTNTQEQQAKTGIKKGINTLTEAAQLNQAIDGFAYNNLTSTENTEGVQSLYHILKSQTNVDTGKSVTDSKIPVNGYDGLDSFVWLRDGSVIMYKAEETKTTDANGTNDASGLPLGFTVVYDTNGAKGPNVLSNCLGNTLGVDDRTQKTPKKDADKNADGTYDAEDMEETETNITACDTKQKRVIKDQFLIQLKGAQAVPAGPAATWAYTN